MGYSVRQTGHLLVRTGTFFKDGKVFDQGDFGNISCFGGLKQRMGIAK